MDDIHVVSALEKALAEVMRRARVEFVEMPGMQLTPAQAARMWHVEPELCAAAFSALVDARFLVKTRKGKFARA